MFEKFLEKKTFILNCDVCDARKMKEEDLAAYEQIVINADVLIVNERSKSIFNRLPAICNADATLELDGDFHLTSYNGDYEISGTTPVFPNTLLTVNGNLKIHPGTEEVLKSFLAIFVNGTVQCPQSLTSFLNGLHVNGSIECYPDGCIVLDPVFTPDAWFALRARENGKYFVSGQVRLTDPKLDLVALTAKKIRFFTPSLLVPEEKVSAAVSLIDETVRLDVIPAGYAFADGDFSLDESFLSRYGTRIYVSGSLSLIRECESLLSRLEGLIVRGTVFLPAGLEEAFSRIGAEYGSLSVSKGSSLSNKVVASLDNAILDASPDGISISNCAAVRIHRDVNPQRILDLVSFSNCARIFCTPGQKSAVELVSRNVPFIGSDGENGGEGGGGLLDMVKQMAHVKVVNADQYVL